MHNLKHFRENTSQDERFGYQMKGQLERKKFIRMKNEKGFENEKCSQDFCGGGSYEKKLDLSEQKLLIFKSPV